VGQNGLLVNRREKRSRTEQSQTPGCSNLARNESEGSEGTGNLNGRWQQRPVSKVAWHHWCALHLHTSFIENRCYMDTCKTEQHFDKILTRCVRESITIRITHSLACSRDIRKRNVRRLDAEEKLRKLASTWLIAGLSREWLDQSWQRDQLPRVLELPRAYGHARSRVTRAAEEVVSSWAWGASARWEGRTPRGGRLVRVRSSTREGTKREREEDREERREYDEEGASQSVSHPVRQSTSQSVSQAVAARSPSLVRSLTRSLLGVLIS